jgi:hypothetical protein
VELKAIKLISSRPAAPFCKWVVSHRNAGVAGARRAPRGRRGPRRRPAKSGARSKGRSERKGSPYRSGRSPDWLKMKNRACEAVRREAGSGWLLIAGMSAASKADTVLGLN